MQCTCTAASASPGQPANLVELCEFNAGVSPAAGPVAREAAPTAADDGGASDLESFLSELESSGLMERGGGAPAAAELASQPSGGAVAEQQQPLGPVEGAPGWLAALDTATAKVYYWHGESNTVSWEPPPGAAAVLGPPPVAAAASGEEAAPAAEPEEDPQWLCEATEAVAEEASRAITGKATPSSSMIAVSLPVRPARRPPPPLLAAEGRDRRRFSFDFVCICARFFCMYLC